MWFLDCLWSAVNVDRPLSTWRASDGMKVCFHYYHYYPSSVCHSSDFTLCTNWSLGSRMLHRGFTLRFVKVMSDSAAHLSLMLIPDTSVCSWRMQAHIWREKLGLKKSSSRSGELLLESLCSFGGSSGKGRNGSSCSVSIQEVKGLHLQR